jgi:hypothetical protein
MNLIVQKTIPGGQEYWMKSGFRVNRLHVSVTRTYNKTILGNLLQYHQTLNKLQGTYLQQVICRHRVLTCVFCFEASLCMIQPYNIFLTKSKG